MANANDEDDFGCSEPFELLPSDEMESVGETDYYLEVTSPSTGDVAMAGEEYTIEVTTDEKPETKKLYRRT